MFAYTAWTLQPSMLNVIHYFLNNDQKDDWGQTASPCKVWWLSVILLLRCGDISMFQDGGRRHLGFLKCPIFHGRKGQEGSKCVTLPNFVEIGQTVADMGKFSIFPRWRLSAI